MRYNLNVIEVVDPDLPAGSDVTWRGPADEFFAANADAPLSTDELARLAAEGQVFVGGGAAAEFCVRYGAVA